MRLQNVKFQRTKELLLKIIERVGRRGPLNVRTLSEEVRAAKLFRTSKEFYAVYSTLKRRGYLEVVKPQSTKSLVRITEKGLSAAVCYRCCRSARETRAWDGWWRLVIFDIPEDVHKLRDHFRRLLQSYGFQMLQASVWVHPHDVFDELEQVMPDIKKHGWIKLLLAKEIIGVGEDYLKEKFGLARHQSGK